MLEPAWLKIFTLQIKIDDNNKSNVITGGISNMQILASMLVESGVEKMQVYIVSRFLSIRTWPGFFTCYIPTYIGLASLSGTCRGYMPPQLKSNVINNSCFLIPLP